MSIKLGQGVECIITGFKGTVTTVYDFLHGCRRIEIQPPMKEDGTVPDSKVIDEPQLKITDKTQKIKATFEKKKLKMGQKVKDPVSGFEGVVIARAAHVNGCYRVGVTPQLDKDGKFQENQWFDEPQLETVRKTPVVKTGSKRTGGPAPTLDKRKF